MTKHDAVSLAAFGVAYVLTWPVRMVVLLLRRNETREENRRADDGYFVA